MSKPITGLQPHSLYVVRAYPTTPPAGPEGRHVTGDERKRQQWREQVLTLAEQPDVQVGRRHAAAAAGSRWAGVAHLPTYLRATKPAYGAPQAACALGL